LVDGRINLKKKTPPNPPNGGRKTRGSRRLGKKKKIIDGSSKMSGVPLGRTLYGKDYSAAHNKANRLVYKKEKVKRDFPNNRRRRKKKKQNDQKTEVGLKTNVEGCIVWPTSKEGWGGKGKT